MSTIQRRLSAINQRHAAAKLNSPTHSAIVRLTMQGIRRTHAPAQDVRKVQSAVTSVIYKRVNPLGTSLIDQRDRALILIGFAGAFRRSELAQLLLTDITETDDGLCVQLRQALEVKALRKAFLTAMNTKRVQCGQARKTATGITDGYASARLRVIGSLAHPSPTEWWSI